MSSLHFAMQAKAVCKHVKMNYIYSAEQLMGLVEQLQRELLRIKCKAARQQDELVGNYSLSPRGQSVNAGGVGWADSHACQQQVLSEIVWEEPEETVELQPQCHDAEPVALGQHD